MNSKQLVVLACGVALVSVGAIASVPYFKSEAFVTKFSTNHQESARQATVTALTQQIAQIEVEEVLQGVRFNQDAVQIVQLKEQQLSLKQRLAQLQPNSNQSPIAIATANAIKSKIADLEVEYAQGQAKFLDSHPILQVQKAQIEALRQRLTSLQ